jgi:hypothetical protein
VTFARFMANPIGRGARIIVGIAIVAIGLLVVGGGWGIVLTVVGVVMFLAGAVNFCLLAPIIGAPFKGRDAA